MFTIEQRDYVRDCVLEMARTDPPVAAGAYTGSMALGPVDEWSDIDITFGITDGVNIEMVLDDWTETLGLDLGTLHYWDLRAGSSIYRVFLLPSGIEVDLSVTPQKDFGARGPQFRTLFGATRPPEPAAQPSARYLTGLGWHHVLHARTSIERAKPWEAEYWISALRDHTFDLMCLRLGESAWYARGVDRLPVTLTEPFADALVRSLDAAELRRALGVATECFIGELEASDPALCAQLRPILLRFGVMQRKEE